MVATKTPTKVQDEVRISKKGGETLRMTDEIPQLDEGGRLGQVWGRTASALWVPLNLGFTALRGVVRFLFAALREAYWVLDRDAKVRSQGLQTLGRVVQTESEKHTDAETGNVTYSHHVSYEYRLGSRTHSARKGVAKLGNLVRGVPIRVYWLPETHPVASAIDREPRALTDSQRGVLESGQRQAIKGESVFVNGSGRS